MKDNLYKNFSDRINPVKGSFDCVIKSVKSGKNSVYRNVISKAITFDRTLIDMLEQGILSLENIVRNPQKFITEEEVVLDVERARRTTSKTIRHLSFNSQYIESVSETGEVRPRKVLSSETEEFTEIYENRFICTLLHNLIAFVENRYREITGKIDAFDQTCAGITSSFNAGRYQCEVDFSLKVKEEPKNKVLLRENNEIVAKIKEIRKRLKILANTKFIKLLSLKKPVYPPILKTNIIKTNVNYNNCYKLWLYISKYSFAAFSVNYKQKNLPVKEDFYEELAALCAAGAQVLLADETFTGGNHLSYSEDIKEKKYKVITSYSFIPKPVLDKLSAKAEAVNEYYFKAIKEELVRASKKSELTVEKDLSLSFAQFYRNLSKINTELYKNVYLLKETGKPETPQTAIAKKTEKFKKQRTFVNRLRQLSALKREEYEKILKLEAKERLNLERAKDALDKEKGVRKRRKDALKKRKELTAKVTAKKSISENRAKEYEDKLRRKADVKIMLTEEKKRIKREQAKRRRDLKRLQELKEMYDENQG